MPSQHQGYKGHKEEALYDYSLVSLVSFVLNQPYEEAAC
jgi:hypothetical protein